MKSSTAVPVRIITHNVRYATTAPFQGEELWTVRKPFLINELSFNTRYCPEAFICLQEVLHNQLLDIKHGLNQTLSEWDYVGVGREDGKTAGEYSPIFYRPGVWELKKWETVWLSETPEKPSKGWDAASTRIVTIAMFLHRETRKRLLALNTHLDDQGHISRLESAKLIQKEISIHADQGANQRSLPVFLAGDFNSQPEQEAYMEMTKTGSAMADLQGLVPEGRHYGEADTYTGFDPANTLSTRIDFIFLNYADPDQTPLQNHSMTKWWTAKGYAVLPNRFEDGVFNSDHRAVVGDVLLS